MSRTVYWCVLIVATAAAVLLWSGPARRQQIAQHPHVAAILEQFNLPRAQAQTPPTTPAAFDSTGQAPVYQQPSNQQPFGGQPSYQPLVRQPGVSPQPRQYQAPGTSPAQHQFNPQSVEPQPEVIEGAQVIATAGDLVVLAEEVIGPVNQTLATYAGKVPKAQIEKTRRMLIQRQLKSLIPTKLLYGEYLVTVPPEGQQAVSQQLSKRFVEEQLPKMMEKAKVQSRVDLDAKFRSLGTSLERQRQQYIENQIAGQWIHQNLKYDRDVTYDQMLEYYRKNIADYEVKAKVRWRQLSIDFTKAGGEQAAQAKIVELGNMLWHGADFAEIARKHSHGFRAHEGGEHDWVTRGALASRDIEDALFHLPIGKLSRIISDKSGVHIVKVLERVEDGVTAFTDAQGEIKRKIVKKRRKDAIDAYLASLQEKTEIWTAFDDQPVEPLSNRPTTAPRR